MQHVAWLPSRVLGKAAVAVTCLLLAACGGGGGGGGGATGGGGAAPSGPSAPTGLAYASPATFAVGTAIAPLVPTVSGTVAAYEVTPALPAGLALDAVTGRISGIPTAVTGQAAYTIAASNAVGRTTFALTLTVNPAAPTALSYDNPARLFVGLPVALTASVTGVVESYSVSPALPAGLSFDSANGRIDGTPTAVGSSVTYTVTANNVTGQTTAALPIEVTTLAIEAQAAVASAEIDWATGSNATYDLIRAEAPGCDLDNYASCPGGTLTPDVSPPFIAAGLQNGTSYWFQLEARTSAAIRSNEAGARPDQLTAQQVRAIAIDADGTAYLGGDFRSVGVRTGSGVPLDLATGAAGAFPYVDGIVYAAIGDGEGGWYLGGDFLAVGGLPRYRLARIRSDMSVDAAWKPEVGEARHASGVVHSLALLGDTLYVGGSYFSVNGEPRNGLAGVATSDGSLRTSFDPVFDRPFVVAVAAAGDTVYVGGDFASVNGQPRANLAALRADGTLLDVWDPGANGNISSLAVANDVVYVGGTFTSLGSAARTNLGAIGIDGAPSSWNPAPNAWVSALTVAQDVVYFGGGFTQITGAQRNRVAAVGTDGAVRAWNPGQSWTMEGEVSEIVPAGDTVYLAGQLRRLGSLELTYLAAVGKDGSARAWNPAPDGWPVALAVSGDKIYVGGHISHYRGTVRNRLAAIRADGTLADWAPETNDVVDALAVAGDTVYAGGRFTTANASSQSFPQTRNRLAAMGTDGTLRTWNPNADGNVNALVVHGDTVYVGGEFGALGGVARAHAAAVGTDGLLSSTWNPSPDALVRTLAVADDAIFVGGDFLQLGGEARAHLGLVGVDGALRGWSAALDGPVWTVAVDDDTVYVGGQFLLPAPPAPLERQGFAAFDRNGALLGFTPGMLGHVHAIHVADGVVYFSGGFAEILGLPRRSVAAVGVDGVLRDWHAHDVNQSAVALTSRDGAIHVGGHYTVIPGVP